MIGVTVMGPSRIVVVVDGNLDARPVSVPSPRVGLALTRLYTERA